MLVFTTFVHIYFLVGSDCARSQWFEVGGNTDIKNQGNTCTFPKYYPGVVVKVLVGTLGITIFKIPVISKNYLYPDPLLIMYSVPSKN